MSLTLNQIIPVVSDYSVGIEGDISNEDLLIFKELVAGDLSRMNPGFSGDDLIELQAYLVLDRFETRKPGDNIESEKIKDHTWKLRVSTSSSSWMDKAFFKISTYNMNSGSYGCVERFDSEMPSMAADMIEIERYYDASDEI